MMSAPKSRASGIVGGQEFDDAEPVLLTLPVRLEIVFVLRAKIARSPFSRVLVQDSRYKNGTTKARSLGFLAVPYRALRCDRCLVITT
jgi:hypothetical protein